MLRGGSRRKRQTDWISFALYFSLILIGWLMIYAAGHSQDHLPSILDFGTPAGKQLLWIGSALFLFILASVIDNRFWRTFSYIIYVLAIGMLIIVLFFGITVKGSTSWFHIGGFTFQPAEFAKFATALALASYLSYYKTNLNAFKHQLISMGIVALPAGLILLQPDAGSAFVFSAFFVVLFREGLSPILFIVVGLALVLFVTSLVFQPVWVLLGLIFLGLSIMAWQIRFGWYTLAGLGVLLLLTVLLVLFASWQIALGLHVGTFFYLAWESWRANKIRIPLYVIPGIALSTLFIFGSNYMFNNVLEPHQQDRINVWLRPHLCDPRGSLYNVLQSKMAIGSGGLKGKGYLEGTMTKLNYVPEQSTDFIFSTVGEEQGFIGSMAVIGLYVFLLLRLSILAERMRTPFERQFTYGLFGLLFVHFVVNIGMTMGLLPIIGIPLPFLSYGGSSLLIFSLMFALVLKFDRERYSV